MSDDHRGFDLAYCGLICSKCGAFTSGKCRGCHSPKPMHSRCSVKKCASERGYTSCADCTDFADLKGCKKLNNFISKVFGLIFRSDRIGNLVKIRTSGIESLEDEAHR